MTITTSRPWLLIAVAACAGVIALTIPGIGVKAGSPESSNAVDLKAPAGNLPTTQHASIDGYDAAVLPTGRIITPAGKEINIGAPKPYGMDLSPDEKTLITTNNGSGPFSVTLIRDLDSSPTANLVTLDATFLGVKFSRDGSHFYASGGEDGVIWVGDSAEGKIVGLVNLNGLSHALTGPVDPTVTPNGKVEGMKLRAAILKSEGLPRKN